MTTLVVTFTVAALVAIATPSGAVRGCDLLVISSAGIDRCVVEGGQGAIDAGNVARYTPLSAAGTNWLAGHRTSHGGTFRELTNVQIGDVVYYRNNNYVVSDYALVNRLNPPAYVLGWQRSDNGLVLQTTQSPPYVHVYNTQLIGPGTPPEPPPPPLPPPPPPPPPPPATAVTTPDTTAVEGAHVAEPVSTGPAAAVVEVEAVRPSELPATGTTTINRSRNPNARVVMWGTGPNWTISKSKPAPNASRATHQSRTAARSVEDAKLTFTLMLPATNVAITFTITATSQTGHACAIPSGLDETCNLDMRVTFEDVD